MRKVWKLAGITASVIIGAGFATGREIKTYFTQYGVYGYLLMAAGAVLLFLGSLRLLDSRKRYFRVPLMAYVFFTYVLMLAALGDLVDQNTFLPGWLGILLGAGISLLGVLAGFGRFTGISGILSPIVALGLTGILLFLVKCPLPSSNLLLQRTPQPGGGLLSWALLLYSGYNFLSAMIVLPEIGREYTKKQKVLGCGLGIAGVFLCIFLIHNAFLECYSIAETADMPLIQLIFTLGSKKASGISLSLLTLTLLLSVCGSAVGFARMAAPGNGERKIGIFMTAAGTPLAFLGFGNLMDYVYPAFGAAGGIMLLIYLTGYFKKIILYRKNKMRSGHGTVEFQE